MRRDRSFDPFYLGVEVDFIYDELELGKRATLYIGTEQEGWGAWVDPKIFEINLNPVVLQRDWTRDPETGTDPYRSRSVKYGPTPYTNGIRRHAPTKANPIAFPAQRKGS